MKVSAAVRFIQLLCLAGAASLGVRAQCQVDSDCVQPSNRCLINACDSATHQCVIQNAVCTPPNSCANASCQPSVGCVYTATASCPTNVDGIPDIYSNPPPPPQCTSDADCTNNACHSNGACDIGTGQCVYNTTYACPPASNPCIRAQCVDQSGIAVCVQTPDTCNGNNACETGQCILQNGNPACQYVQTPNFTSCDDGNVCTQTDACYFGYCIGSNPISCNQIGFAANLNAGDAVVNVSNSGSNGGFLDPAGAGNICANVFVFDPQEEEVGCCSCLVTPDGLNSLSAKSDLISNLLTAATPSSVVINLIPTTPGLDNTGKYTICNPATAASTPALSVTGGMLVWGTTLEPAANVGAYSPVQVPFINGGLSASELNSLTSLCSFIQTNGTGFGICNSCRTGALGGAKR
jgi:hypothetical protein